MNVLFHGRLRDLCFFDETWHESASFIGKMIFKKLMFYFLLFDQAEEVEAVLANAKQILNQFLRKSRILSRY